jgi:uncharacterized protein YndB with AHSA1/START domain
MTPTTSAAPALTLRRTYPVARQRVFDAWTTPGIAATFFGPGDTKATDITMDVRPGGAYSITMVRPDGERLIATGVYREVVAPERVSMTWRWVEDDPADEHESLLTLEFNDRGGETELVLTHAQLASVESRDRHAEGWNMILDELGKLELAG